MTRSVLVKRVLLIGSGSIGRRHLRTLRDRLPDATVTLLRRRDAPPLDPDVAAEVDRVVDRLDAAVEPRPDIAVIASPATTHLDLALPLAELGVGMLIEKPLSIDLDRCLELEARCVRNQAPVVIGYTLRYHPGFIALQERLAAGDIGRVLMARAEVGQHLADWRPGTDYRASVTAQRALGGGALLELSHEIDLVRALLGMPVTVSAHLDRVGDLAIDTEDTADVLLVYAIDDGHRAVASIHLDLLQRPPRRRLTLTGTDGRLELDLLAGTLVRHAGDRRDALPVQAVAHDDLYRAEIEDLIDALEGGVPRVGLRDGIETQQLLDAARRSAETRRVVDLGAAA